MLAINCKEAGDPQCSHTITGDTEPELFENAKKTCNGFTRDDCSSLKKMPKK